MDEEEVNDFFFLVTFQFILFKSFQLIMMFPGPDSSEQWFSKFLHHSPHCRNKYFHTPSKPNRGTEKPSCNFTQIVNSFRINPSVIFVLNTQLSFQITIYNFYH